MKWLCTLVAHRNTYLLSHGFCGSESGHNLPKSSAPGPWLQLSQRCKLLGQPGCSVTSRLCWGRFRCQDMRFLVGFNSLWFKWVSVSFCFWLSNGGFLCSLAMWVSPSDSTNIAAGFMKSNKGESASKMDHNLLQYFHRYVIPLPLQYSFD